MLLETTGKSISFAFIDPTVSLRNNITQFEIRVVIWISRSDSRMEFDCSNICAVNGRHNQRTKHLLQVTNRLCNLCSRSFEQSTKIHQREIRQDGVFFSPMGSSARSRFNHWMFGLTNVSEERIEFFNWGTTIIMHGPYETMQVSRVWLAASCHLCL